MGVIAFLRRIGRAIGREIVATIRFGALPAAAAPDGMTRQIDPDAAVAGITSLSDAEFSNSRRPPER